MLRLLGLAFLALLGCIAGVRGQDVYDAVGHKIPPVVIIDPVTKSPVSPGTGLTNTQLRASAVPVSTQHLVGTATPSSYTATTTSGTVLAANANRSDTVITNYSATGCFLARGATAVAGQGIYLAPNGGAYNIDANNLYRGQITAITSSGSATLSVSEGN
jgi:hypothetical protein